MRNFANLSTRIKLLFSFGLRQSLQAGEAFRVLA